jgi:AGCS family alanine or glycine:cation symporter
MYRGRDAQGQVQGGPMYFIVEGLGPKWKPLAMAFCFFGVFGCLPLFSSNQLTAFVVEMFFKPNEWFVGTDKNVTALGQGVFGAAMALCVGVVILGGIKRIGKVAARLVPFMVLLYGGCALVILFTHAAQVPESIALIFHDAFTGDAVAGGVLGAVISTGVRRAAFSNEAGMGTEAMAHGAAKTKEPIREGLVAMLGPMIDTLIVCTITGLIILSTGVWESTGDNPDGVLLTAEAFTKGIPFAGPYLLLVCVLCFSFSSMIGFSYYVTKCGMFLFGPRARIPMILFYLAGIVVSAIVELGDIINFLDIMFGMMAVPTILSTLLLSPRVMARAREYFATLGQAQ